MWQLSVPWWELVLRAFFVYIIVFLIFRLIGKKQLGEMSPFDFVLLLIVSESVSNSLGADENSITGGLILAFTLISLSSVIDFLAFKSKRFEKIVEGQPQFIIKNGKICEDVQRKEKITQEEINTLLRENDIREIKDVRFGVLETNGKITMIKK